MVRTITLFLFFLAIGLPVLCQTTVTLTDKEVTTTSYTNSEVIINGQTDLHLTAGSNPLVNSTIKLNSEDSWVIFDNIRPDTVIASFLQYIYINNQAAVQNTNVRIAIYKHGTAVIPQSSSYQPLEAFTGQNYTGTSQKFSLFTPYTSLAGFDNKIRSIKLKRGYMVTFANNPDGTGYSRVFIADKEDLLLPVLPDLVDAAVSYIRVFNWEWVTKKGWAGWDANDYNKVNITWRYDWNTGGESTPSLEYVTMRPKLNWPDWVPIKNKERVTHILGLNEPEHPEQHKDDNGEKAITVSQALAQWPDMLKTGYRLGSPSPTDWNWLFAFIDSCDARKYRVDFVAWHAYWVKSPSAWYNDLKYIHERTKRPIWITEWNNGANWANENWPDGDYRPDSLILTTANAAKQLNDISKILQVMDTAHFVERYSIYNWVQDARAMVLKGKLTPAGNYYANNKSVIAFNRGNEVIPKWSGYSKPALSLVVGNDSTLSLNSTDPNGDYNKGYRLEKKINNGSFVKIQDTLGLKTVKYTEAVEVSSGRRLRFRIRTILPDGQESGNSNEVGVDVTDGAAIQCGTLSFSNVAWNNVFFARPYTHVAAVIAGSPTNYNPAYLACKVKQINDNRFQFQFAPWAYQNVTSLSKEETVPYLILDTGQYNFGNLKALAGKVDVNSAWTQVNFSRPFDTIPVVFTSQYVSTNNTPTAIRIKNVTKTGFMAKIQKESKASASLYRESASFFAITPGKGVMDNQDIIVGKTQNAPVSTSSLTTILYGDTVANPVFIAQMQTCNDDTVTALLRCTTISASKAMVIKQREKSLGYTVAANEDAGWMVIDKKNTNVGLKTIQHKTLKFYPNPVADELYFEGEFTGETTITIYNMCGAAVKCEKLTGNKVDVNDLPAGYYVIKTSDKRVGKFVKMK